MTTRRHLAPRPLALLLTTVLLAGATVLHAPMARADTTTTAVASAASPTTIDVQWVLTGAPVTSWVVLATRSADRSVVGMQTVCATCTATRFSYLTPGDTYQLTVAGVGAPSGTVWATATAATPADPLCAGTTPCVAVETTTSIGTSTGTGLGLLHGLTSRTDPARVSPLSLNYHRIAAWDPTAFTNAKATGGQIDVLLSDAWLRYAVQTFGRTMNPWEDWEAYRLFVVGVVQWHLDHGQVPDFWEIQNEPDQAAWYRTATLVGAEPTRERVLQQFEVAHDAIRSVLPAAKVVGPSVGSFYPGSGALVDLVSFLDAAAAKGLRFDVIAWHEMGGSCGGGCDGGPRGIAQHIATLRGLLAERPSLGQPDVHVNEFGGPDTVAVPGYAAGYLAAFAATGVAKAASSCWPAVYSGKSYDGCFHDPGTMDHLVMPDGSTPRAAWWVWRAYAAMTGLRVPATTSLVGASVHATRSSAGVVDVLVGRHGGGTSSASPRVRVSVPDKVRKVLVEITTIAPTDGASTPSTVSRSLRVSGGIVDLGTLLIPADAAVTLRITGADAASTTALKAPLVSAAG